MNINKEVYMTAKTKQTNKIKMNASKIWIKMKLC